jgi:hypothetical protein
MMESRDADAALGYLAGVTNDWPDEVSALYLAEFEMLADPEALRAAIDFLLRHRTGETGNLRPPLGDILERYRVEIRSRDNVRELRPASKSFLSPKEGISVAQRAYEAECHRQGRDPRPEIFRKWQEGIGIR